MTGRKWAYRKVLGVRGSAAMSTRVMGCVVALALVVVVALPASATPPGQNGLLVWAGAGEGMPQVWVANPDGSGQRRLFAKRGRGDVEGTFSPTDADLMFFTRFTEAPLSDDIFRGNPTTGEVARVIGGRSADLAPTVSPDGTKIAYFSIRRPKRLREDVPPPPERIKVANIDGSGGRFLTPSEPAKPRSGLVAGRHQNRLLRSTDRGRRRHLSGDDHERRRQRPASAYQLRGRE